MIWWVAITAVGTVLAGLALPLALIQLGALRQDRLRGQIGKVGVWVGKREASGKPDGQPWKIPIFIRNSSELPIWVVSVNVKVMRLGRDEFTRAEFTPRTIPPRQTWRGDYEFGDDDPGRVLPLVDRVHVRDAAGISWMMRPSRPGPPRRITRWRQRRWSREEYRERGPVVDMSSAIPLAISIRRIRRRRGG